MGGAAYLATAHLSYPTNQELVCWFILPFPLLFHFLNKTMWRGFRGPPGASKSLGRPVWLAAFRLQKPRAPQRSQGLRGPGGSGPSEPAGFWTTNSLGLHSGSKQWCECLPDIILGPSGYDLSRPGWEFWV